VLIGPQLTWVEMNALSFDFCFPRPLIALTSRDGAPACRSAFLAKSSPRASASGYHPNG